MNFLIDGTSLDNKGAELMAIAIIQYIERIFPDSTVYYLDYADQAKNGYFKTVLEVKYCRKSIFRKVVAKFHIVGICKKLHIPFPMKYKPVYKNIDVLLDAGGFQFGDNWNYSIEQAQKISEYYKYYYEHGTKIIFLPQSFGELNSDASKMICSALDKYASAVYPRDKESFNNLMNGGFTKPLKIFPDFTCMVNYEYTYKKESINKDTVLLIPNCKMMEMTSISKTDYMNFMNNVIQYLLGKGKNVVLLNHEGIGDEKISYEIASNNSEVQVFTGLNVMEIKSVISECYAVVSGRFHGVANSLNACKPCLATAWNVKYKNLFSDYSVNDMVIECEFNDDTKRKIDFLMNPDMYNNYVNQLKLGVEGVKQKCSQLWENVTSIIIG